MLSARVERASLGTETLSEERKAAPVYSGSFLVRVEGGLRAPPRDPPPRPAKPPREGREPGTPSPRAKDEGGGPRSEAGRTENRLPARRSSLTRCAAGRNSSEEEEEKASSNWEGLEGVNDWPGRRRGRERAEPPSPRPFVRKGKEGTRVRTSSSSFAFYDSPIDSPSEERRRGKGGHRKEAEERKTHEEPPA